MSVMEIIDDGHVLYWVRCGNCGRVFHDMDLAALVLDMHGHWVDFHPGTIHLPGAGRLEIP